MEKSSADDMSLPDLDGGVFAPSNSSRMDLLLLDKSEDPTTSKPLTLALETRVFDEETLEYHLGDSLYNTKIV